MGQQAASRGMCCSIREKDASRSAADYSDVPQFTYNEVELGLDEPRLLAFAPLWQYGLPGMPGGPDGPRRLAVASDKIVHVYRVLDASGGRPPDQVPELTLEYILQMGQRRRITALSFVSEDNSKQLMIASSSSSGSIWGSKDNVVRVWTLLDEQATLPPGVKPRVKELKPDQDFLASLEHPAPVYRLAVTNSYIFTATSSGECRVWHKSRGYACRGVVQIHKGGAVDIDVDRLFVYSTAMQDGFIRIWSVPDLKPVLAIPVELPKDIIANLLEGQTVVDDVKGPDMAFPSATTPEDEGNEKKIETPLKALTALKRPVSRWVGSQGSSRNSDTPKGVLYVAGVLATGAGKGSGVLMEWSVGPLKPLCRSAQIAHDMPIVCLAYGPYDNGPLMTADARGCFRIWDVTPRLACAQRIDVGLVGGDPTGLAMAVDPLCHSLYTIAGGSRLLVWHQMRAGEPEEQPKRLAVVVEGPASPRR